MSNSNAKVTAIITEAGIEVELENWEGVTAIMIEHIHYAIVKKARIQQAQKLGALHKAKMEQDAQKEKAVVEETPAAVPEGKRSIVGNFIEELGNVLRA
jgi:hypothetical protein